MRSFLFPFALFATTLPTLPAVADTVQIDVEALTSQTAYNVAQITPLALDAAGDPLVILLDLSEGDVVPPHAARSNLRLLTVLSGTLYWGDGETVDPAQERVFEPGSFLVIRESEPHWLAARDGDLRLQLVTINADAPVPGIQEQMQ